MTIDFEKDQQDAMSKTEHIQSLADQVQRLEGLLHRIELSENNLKDLKKEYQRIIRWGDTHYDEWNGACRT